jgi:hypothetical protein
MLKKLTARTALAITAAGVLAHTALAGTEAADAMKKEVPVTEPEKPAFSGWLSFDLNSHFISYGTDVWKGGTNWNKGVFNPSAELDWASPIPGVTLIVGTWWDVTNNTVSPIGGWLQEVDVWAGASYAYKDLSATVLYQAWNYGGDTEQILDVILKYSNNMFLNPAITIHNRLDPGASGGNNGTYFVPNLSYNFKLWQLTITPSAAIAFCTDDYNAGGGGYAYTALGLNGSIPIPYLPGNWELHGGITYYNTNDYTVPGNPAENFVTGNIGIKLSF